MKRIAVLFLLVFVMTLSAFSAPIFKYETTEAITDTVTLTKVKEFHFDHNMSYSYIKMDLTDDRVKLKLLTSPEGTDILDTVPNLAKSDESTVAALNGDFFSAFSGNKGFSLGIEKDNGTILQSPINPDTMATVAYDGKNVLMSYLDYALMVVAPNWEYHPVRHINKHTTYYGEILMYTSSFNSGYSPAPGGNVLEVVVEDNKIVEFRREMEPCLIPQNGCVLVVSEGSTMFFANNFNVGDEIKFDWYITPSLDDYEIAFGGGSMLVSDGQDVGIIGDYTHTVAGFHPRSAIGIDKDGTTLYLVAVDGRQESSRGMRMSHLAELMISLGCYTAVNLDGGGSTYMVASTLWNEDIHSVNNPTENRKVINAVGIALNNPVSEFDDEETEDDEETYNDKSQEQTDEKSKEISGIKIKASRTEAFVGEEIEFEVAAHDEQMRRVAFDEKDLVFSISGGEIKGNVLTSEIGGKITVGVTLDEFYSDIDVYYVKDICGIVTEELLILDKGNKHNLDISVFDSMGCFVKPENYDAFDFASSDTDVVTVDNGTVKAKSDGTAIVFVSKDEVVSHVPVVVGRKTWDYSENFESINGSFISYPDDTKGNFELSDEYSFNGSFSGKLSFDFTDNISEEEQNTDLAHDETEQPEDIARAVYYSLYNNVPIDDSCDTITINVYSDAEFNHTVRAQLVLGDGNVMNLEFDGEITAGEWCELRLSVPESLKRPLYLSRIYVLYSPSEAKDEGSIWIDRVSFVTSKSFDVPVSPENVYRYCKNNANVKTSVKIGAFSESTSANPATVYNRANLVSSLLDSNGIVISDSMKKSVSEDDNAVYVCLDTSNGGIRNTDSSQWELLKQAASESKRENLFVITNDDVFGSDSFENRVIEDYLSEIDKNVFVVSMGNNAAYKNIKGVKYFTLDATPDGSLSLASDRRRKLIEFHFGETVTFEFKET